ncbi:response regulator transcription factor [Achromobacter sp. NPDC058515]|uniref:response regulator transcription factor n=1 Tax=Achromobacter sp. NPDC058515 TaxID=3346533 RepID=UPI00365786CD
MSTSQQLLRLPPDALTIPEETGAFQQYQDSSDDGMQSLRTAARVYIVDDDDLAVWIIRQLLTDLRIEIVAYSSAEAFAAQYAPTECECLILDLRMPALDGLSLQRRLLERGVAPPIIFITANPEFGDAVEAMKHGAFDFLPKPLNANQLCKAVHAALLASRKMHTKRIRAEEEEARKALLTTRELSIVQGVIAGYSSKEIAERLHLSVRTVENHKAHIYSKLDIHSSLGLARLFIGLVEPDQDQ